MAARVERVLAWIGGLFLVFLFFRWLPTLEVWWYTWVEPVHRWVVLSVVYPVLLALAVLGFIATVLGIIVTQFVFRKKGGAK